MSSTKNTFDFQGLNLKTNYDINPPYCIVEWINGKVQVKGLFMEVLEIAAKYLNLTLIIKQPRPQNKGIWSKK